MSEGRCGSLLGQGSEDEDLWTETRNGVKTFLKNGAD